MKCLFNISCPSRLGIWTNSTIFVLSSPNWSGRSFSTTIGDGSLPERIRILRRLQRNSLLFTFLSSSPFFSASLSSSFVSKRRFSTEADVDEFNPQAVVPEHLSSIQKESFRKNSRPPGVDRLVERYSHIPPDRIRNFSIIAHIDHGKSTLSDKLLEYTGNIFKTEKGKQQVLDTLEVERQRGITVKAQSASLIWKSPEGLEYLLNLIDTPGHVDFSYEVSRSLAACQGALLLVDATQGVQAQTVANFNTAVEAQLSILPVLTKIDLPASIPEICIEGIQNTLGIRADHAIHTSAKAGIGIRELFPAIVRSFPPPVIPSGNTIAEIDSAPLKCLLFDSLFDEFRGVICLVQVRSGRVRPGDTIISAHSREKFVVQEVGLLSPSRVSVPFLAAGHTGYVLCNMKNVRQARVGDTFFRFGAAASDMVPLPGFQPAKPMIFASLFPVDAGDFPSLQTAVERLTLNDASVTVEKESSGTLGIGLRCGFLGLLHMDVFNQRLTDEFRTDVITTAPTVPYRFREIRDYGALAKEIDAAGGFHRLDKKSKAFAFVQKSSLPDAYLHFDLRHTNKHTEIEKQSGNTNISSTHSTVLNKSPYNEDGTVNPDELGWKTVEKSSDFPDAAAAQNVRNFEYQEPMSIVSLMSPAEFVSPLVSLLNDKRGVQLEIKYLRSLESAPQTSAAAMTATEKAEMEALEREIALLEQEEREKMEAAAFEAQLESSTSESLNDSCSSDSEDSDSEEFEEVEESFSASTAPSTDALSNVSAASDRVVIKYLMPWAEVVDNLYDTIKSMTAGYASLDWTMADYKRSSVVKVDILLNGKQVDALSFITHQSNAVVKGRKVAQRLKAVISRQQFEVVIQAAINSKIIARERIAPYRKDVLMKGSKLVGGGDKTRKQKLLAKQKEGKKRMKTIGNVPLSQEAFHSILSVK